MEEDGFEALSYALAWVVINGNPAVFGVKAGMFLYDNLSEKFDVWHDWWEQNANNAKLVNAAVKKINADPEFIKYLPSEARAHILDTLCIPVDGWEALKTWEMNNPQDTQWNKLNLTGGLNEPQETAILKVLKWLQSKNDLDNVLLHMGKPLANGKKLRSLSSEQKQARRDKNVHRIYTMLDDGQKEQFRTWWTLLEADAKRPKEANSSGDRRMLPRTSKDGAVQQVLNQSG